MDGKRTSASEAYAARLEAVKGRRHPSTLGALEKATEDRLDVIQLHDLSDEDKRLAELGYVQV